MASKLRSVHLKGDHLGQLNDVVVSDMSVFHSSNIRRLEGG